MFIESPRFPTDLSIESKFGPAYSTSIARNIGGFEVNNQNWAMPLYEGDVSYAVKNQARLDELLAFFHSVAGMHNGFRFKNFADYRATGTQGMLVALSASTWQMYKGYIYGALEMERKISKPIAATVVLTGTGTYTVNGQTGVVTKTAGADPTAWVGEFDFPVRFNTDKMLPQALSFELYQWKAIPIIELRL